MDAIPLEAHGGFLLGGCESTEIIPLRAANADGFSGFARGRRGDGKFPVAMSVPPWDNGCMGWCILAPTGSAKTDNSIGKCLLGGSSSGVIHMKRLLALVGLMIVCTGPVAADYLFIKIDLNKVNFSGGGDANGGAQPGVQPGAQPGFQPGAQPGFQPGGFGGGFGGKGMMKGGGKG